MGVTQTLMLLPPQSKQSKGPGIDGGAFGRENIKGSPLVQPLQVACLTSEGGY